MKVYLFDGTFEGLLSALYKGLKENHPMLRIESSASYQPDLFTEASVLVTDHRLAQRLFQLICQEMSSRTLRHVYRVYLSEVSHGGTLLLPFLLKGFRLGPGVNDLITDPAIYPVLRLSRRVSREFHRYLGLLRFQELEQGLLYARMEPDFNQTPLLAPHFSRRLPASPWIIHDIRRELAACWDTREWILRDLTAEGIPSLSVQEKSLQDLWQTYFQHIAIQERQNPRVQQNFMPKKYWKHLVERPGQS